MLEEEECPFQSQFLGKRGTVDIARAQKEDYSATAKASRKILLVDQLSKCRKSEWVTSSEKYVELIATRSEEPRARKRL